MSTKGKDLDGLAGVRIPAEVGAKSRSTGFKAIELFFPPVPTARSVVLVLGLFLATSFVAALVYLAVTRPTYTASLVIGPTQEQFSTTPRSQLENGAYSLLSSGGLLSGPRIISPYDAYLKTAQSREVAERLYADPIVRAGLFPQGWDDASKTWRPTGGVKHFIGQLLAGIAGRPYPTHPTVDNVESVLDGEVHLGMVERGPMYSISYSSADREFAMSFIQKVFLTTDAIVKAKNRADVLERIKALKARMNDLDVIDYRTQFVTLLMDQEKQLLLLQSDSNFAATEVVAPGAPDFPDSPRLYVTILLFAVLFFLLGTSILAYVYRSLIASRLRPSPA